jgi:hypothetical protein
VVSSALVASINISIMAEGVEGRSAVRAELFNVRVRVWVRVRVRLR